jgi:cytochrome c biogenesis protein CcmG/thiol:disulfide interchange protein DsbE
MTDSTPDIQPTEVTKSRPRWGTILAWSGLVLLLLIVAFSLFRTQQGPVAIGQKAPDFVLTTFDGQQIDSRELRGKVILLNFWASWCKPCEQEAADLEAAWRDYQDSDQVIFLGVDWTDTETAAFEYLDKFDITYPNGADLGTRISQVYRTTGVPETYIIDKDGLLVAVKLSPYTSIAEIKAAIEPLLDQ